MIWDSLKCYLQNTAPSEIFPSISFMWNKVAQIRIVQGRSSMTKGHLSGTMGWRPPEVLVCYDRDSGNGTSSYADLETSLTASLDISPLGCIFYHVLSVTHPFD